MTRPLVPGTTYEVVTAAGVPVQAFSGLDARKRAVAYAKHQGQWIPGLVVEEVTVIVQRRRVYRPRPAVQPQQQEAVACPV
jgi:hypothetical protein